MAPSDRPSRLRTYVLNSDFPHSSKNALLELISIKAHNALAFAIAFLTLEDEYEIRCRLPQRGKMDSTSCSDADNVGLVLALREHMFPLAAPES